MLEWVQWAGSVLGLLGLIVSAFGLRYAVLAHRAANLAKNAAASAEDAANSARRETQRALGRSLNSRDIGDAVALINILKALQLQGAWPSALWLYQELRKSLTVIRGNLPAGFGQFINLIDEAVSQILAMEDLVTRSLHRNEQPDDPPELNATLNGIQQELQVLRSNMTYDEIRGGN